jgi:hypothetical protein
LTKYLVCTMAFNDEHGRLSYLMTNPKWITLCCHTFVWSFLRELFRMNSLCRHLGALYLSVNSILCFIRASTVYNDTKRMHAEHTTVLPLRRRLSRSNPVHQGSCYALPPLRVIMGSRERSRASRAPRSVPTFPMETLQ